MVGSNRKHDENMDKNSLIIDAENGEKKPDSLLQTSGVTRKESYKAQRKNYRKEKKRAAREVLTTLQDPSTVLLADWLKVRGTLKSWTKLWCVLKPGVLLLYKSSKAKSSGWVGTIILSTCELIERPSKKDGFCFKIFHPLEQSIWAIRGPQSETIPAVVQPLPNTHLIFRATSAEDGKCWMDALELALRCSSQIIRASTSTNDTESDIEKHFPEHDMTSHADEAINIHSEHSETDSDADITQLCEPEMPEETVYEEEEAEKMGMIGSGVGQTEELEEESKSILWFLLKQVRPGMDLSKVVLPTFILEPRSFLDKLSDYYYHVDLLCRAISEDNPKERMKSVVRWYLSGFYKKPEGIKKPYNPILGETFRCCWHHPSHSKTFFIAEQVSHHPPVSAFYVTNRKEGFTVSGSILAKSKFYGNSTSAILMGVGCLTLLTRGEEYLLTMPYAHCKGILMGTLSMELGGKVTISCSKTRYVTELEFKLKPFLGGAEVTNTIVGKLNLEKETIGTFSGHWDSTIYYTDKKTGEQEILWDPTPEIRSKRLKRFVVPLGQQDEWESVNLWKHVSQAIKEGDQEKATEEKTKLEEAQRNSAKDRKARGMEWKAKNFSLDLLTEKWIYKHYDERPWDHYNDVMQYERDYEVRTLTRHKTLVRASSLITHESQEILTHPESCSSSAEAEEDNGFLTCRREHSNFIDISNELELINQNIQKLIEAQKEVLSRLEILSQGNYSTSDWFKLCFIFIIQTFLLWALLLNRRSSDHH